MSANHQLGSFLCSIYANEVISLALRRIRHLVSKSQIFLYQSLWNASQKRVNKLTLRSQQYYEQVCNLCNWRAVAFVAPHLTECLIRKAIFCFHPEDQQVFRVVRFQLFSLASGTVPSVTHGFWSQDVRETVTGTCCPPLSQPPVSDYCTCFRIVQELHFVLQPMARVTLGPAYNEFDYNEHPAANGHISLHQNNSQQC